jgi:DNA (cytosine-5)-methyltransferase 1
MTHNILDLFCGTGGFSYGFEMASTDFQTRLGIDLLPTSVRTFKANRPDALAVTGDIRKIRRSDIAERLGLGCGKIDVIIGGPPCQGFSSIRPFRSSLEDDPRNSLFEEYAAYVNFFRPKAFILENVVGLATYQSGSTLAQMEECFSMLGYRTDWRILNAAHFGVPQKRERFIMIGVQNGGRIQFPSPTHHSESPTIGVRDRKKMQMPEMPSLFSAALTTQPALTVSDAISDLPAIKSGASATNYSDGPLNPYQADRRKRAKNLTLHSSTEHTPKMLEIIRHAGRNISSIPKHLISSGFSSCYSRLDGAEPAVTITVNFVHPASNRCIHPFQDRALTPREGARLQSFDDHFVFSGNRTEIVKQIGNAVPPLLGKAIARSLIQVL